jgi:phospholipid/cholesterol/gamma-HCH transport system substrate-binding protein
MRLKMPDKLVAAALALVLTFLICVSYLLAGVLKIPLTNRPDQVTVSMSSTGGLFKGSAVTYRGTRVGTITDIQVGKTGPEATITFRSGAKVPVESKAQVRSLSPVGEQFLDLQPEDDGGPYLEDGDKISAEVVDLPVTVASAAGNLDQLLQNIDDNDIKVLMRELNAGVTDSSDDLEQLLDSSSQLVSTLDEAWPRTQDLLVNGKTVNQIVAAHRQDLATFATSARRLTQWLRTFDPTFQRILRNAPSDLDAVGLLVKDLGPLLPPLLANLDATTNILADRDASVRALSYTVPWGVGRFNTIFRGGWAYLDAYIQGQVPCDYGNPPKPPSQPTRDPLFADGHCGSDDPERWRAAQHALPPIDR